MNDNIIWVVEGKIKKENKKDYLTLMNEMVEAVKKEPGTLAYEWTLGLDSESVQVYERYANEEETKKHLLTWGKFATRYTTLVSITKFTVFSELSDELKQSVSGLNPVYMSPVGGFSRF